MATVSIASKSMKRATGLKAPEYVLAATATITSDMCYGGLINTYGQAADMVVLHELAHLWKDSLRNPAISAYYNGEIAKLENSEKNMLSGKMRMILR